MPDSKDHADYSSSGAGSLLRFCVAGNDFAIDLDRVREVAKVSAIHPVPFLPAHIRGIMNLRGEIIPVVDIHTFIQNNGEDGLRRKRLVIVEHEETTMGILSDGEESTEECPQQSHDHKADDKLAGLDFCRIGRISLGGANVTLLDADRLLNKTRINPLSTP